jgi:hypothetical protein
MLSSFVLFCLCFEVGRSLPRAACDPGFRRETPLLHTSRRKTGGKGDKEKGRMLRLKFAGGLLVGGAITLSQTILSFSDTFEAVRRFVWGHHPLNGVGQQKPVSRAPVVLPLLHQMLPGSVSAGSNAHNFNPSSNARTRDKRGQHPAGS